MAGIKSYNTYIPKYRVKISSIARAWGKNPKQVISSLGVREKAVSAADEDAATMAVSAAAGLNRKTKTDIVFVGSESHPYAVNPTSTIVGEMLGFGNSYFAADLEFACKAATAGLQASLGLVESGRAKSALIIGSDRAQSKPHDPLEYTAASAAAAFILAEKKVIAEIKETASYSSDTPDFWRRDGIKYPSHGGRFTGKPAYFAHIKGAAGKLFDKSGKKPKDFKYCVFHMPNGKFPSRAAESLGFNEKQLGPSLVVKDIGNPYSASCLIGLAAVLDIAVPGDSIFMVSYGSGAGADGFVFEAADEIVNFREKQKQTVMEQIKKKEYISYVEYLKMTNQI